LGPINVGVTRYFLIAVQGKFSLDAHPAPLTFRWKNLHQ
jgi:hypothetical protein